MSNSDSNLIQVRSENLECQSLAQKLFAGLFPDSSDGKYALRTKYFSAKLHCDYDVIAAEKSFELEDPIEFEARVYVASSERAIFGNFVSHIDGEESKLVIWLQLGAFPDETVSEAVFDRCLEMGMLYVRAEPEEIERNITTRTPSSAGSRSLLQSSQMPDSCADFYDCLSCHMWGKMEKTLEIASELSPPRTVSSEELKLDTPSTQCSNDESNAKESGENQTITKSEVLNECKKFNLKLEKEVTGNDDCDLEAFESLMRRMKVANTTAGNLTDEERRERACKLTLEMMDLLKLDDEDD